MAGKKRSQSIPIDSDMMEALKRQEQRFIDKFGRTPGPNDPVFFDPSAAEPRPILDEVLDQHLLEAMHRAGVYPAVIHAYQKTGRLVSKENQKFLSRQERQEWKDAINEWYDEHDSP